MLREKKSERYDRKPTTETVATATVSPSSANPCS